MSSAKLGELGLIRSIRARAGKLSSSSVRLGIGDDCALLLPKRGHDLAITTDFSIAGRHFRLEWHTPESAGHRALARGLSDLASMGAEPVAAFLSLGLPRDLALGTQSKAGKFAESSQNRSWVDRFFDGLLALAQTHNTPLAGGDTSETPIVLADIVLVGSVPRGKALLRSNARPGDLLYVTGTLGGGAAALPHLDRLAKETKAGANGIDPNQIPKDLAPLLARHLYPQPRIAQGLRLRKDRLAAAAIDTSDGLSSDLAHICEESHVSAEVDARLLPIHPGASLEYALHGGDDYELLFTARPNVRMPRKIAGIPITRIGRILPARRNRPTVTVLTATGIEPLTAQGWEHFA